MTVSAGTIAPRRRADGAMWTMLLTGGGAFLGWQVVAGGTMLRILVAGAMMGVLAVPAIRRPRAAVLGLFVVMPFLGVIRHAFVGGMGAAVFDPLLLLPSAVALAIFGSLTVTKRMRFSGTPLATVMFLLMLMGLLQVFNPGQGGVAVGLAGGMINLIPMGFFFIARTVADEAMTWTVLRIVLVAGIVVAAYGLVQVFAGFRGFEKVWIEEQGPQALRIADTIRPFSTFNNPAEYAMYLLFAFVVALAIALFATGAWRALALPVAGFIVYAGFLIGGRGFTVKIALAVIILLAVRARNRALAIGVIAALISLAVFWVANTSVDEKFADKKPGVQQLVFNQVYALADPFDPKKSTLPNHFNQFWSGITAAFTKTPFGLGTGVATRAGVKFGGVQGATELDISDVFQSFGIAGGILYAFAIVLVLRQMSRLRRAIPGPLWTAVWVMALTSIGVWLIGGLYAIAPLIWFLIGAADGAYERMRGGKAAAGGAYERARDGEVAGSTLPV